MTLDAAASTVVEPSYRSDFRTRLPDPGDPCVAAIPVFLLALVAPALAEDYLPSPTSDLPNRDRA